MKKHFGSLDGALLEPAAPKSGEIVSGQPSAVTRRLAGFTNEGVPLLERPGGEGGRTPARTCVPLDLRDVGRDIVVVFDEGDPDRPVVLGLVQTPVAPKDRDIVLDGKSVVLQAEESVTLRCGKGSITLTADGKVVIRGAHVVSQAAGVNRIRGGSVQLN